MLNWKWKPYLHRDPSWSPQGKFQDMLLCFGSKPLPATVCIKQKIVHLAQSGDKVSLTIKNPVPYPAKLPLSYNVD